MVISSRTPEGTPNHCPICGHDLRLEPSWPALDAPCPHCGHLLWFPSERSSALEQGPTDVLKRRAAAILELASTRFGPLPTDICDAIKAIGDPDRLRAILERVGRCRSLDDMRAGL